MGRVFPYCKAAIALVDARLCGSRAAALQHGVSQRTVQLWRRRLLFDDELRNQYDRLMSQALNHWAEKLPQVLSDSLEFLSRSCHEADPVDPDVIKAITQAIAVVAEIYTMQLELRSRGVLDGSEHSDSEAH